MLKRLVLAFFLGMTPALAPLTVSAQEAPEVQPVNINTADAGTLAMALDGIGRSRAEAIVQYRESYGPFFTVDDLLEVRGVGPSVLKKNRDRIVLE